MTAPRLHALLACLMLGAAGPAWATTVFVMGITDSNVQLIIDKSAVRQIGIGETTPEGVKLLGIENGVALLQVDRRTMRLAIGQSTSSELVVQMGPDRQFRVTAYINGIAVRALIDTGASNVALTVGIADRVGVNYQGARRHISHTANGAVGSYAVSIPSIQIGDIVLTNVQGSVLESRISQNDEVLIGNSFLSQVHMQRSGNTMVITRPNGF